MRENSVMPSASILTAAAAGKSGTGIANRSDMRDADTATRDSSASERRLMRDAVRASRRARAHVEARDRVRMMLLKLSRYDSRYSEMLSNLERAWLWE